MTKTVLIDYKQEVRLSPVVATHGGDVVKTEEYPKGYCFSPSIFGLMMRPCGQVVAVPVSETSMLVFDNDPDACDRHREYRFECDSPECEDHLAFGRFALMNKFAAANAEVLAELYRERKAVGF